jgi:bacterioferritin-associated ferredoxin
MIVCLCKNVSDGHIKRLLSEGKSLQDIIRLSQAGTACGACTHDIRKCAESDRESQSAKASHKSP